MKIKWCVVLLGLVAVTAGHVAAEEVKGTKDDTFRDFIVGVGYSTLTMNPESGGDGIDFAGGYITLEQMLTKWLGFQVGFNHTEADDVDDLVYWSSDFVLTPQYSFKGFKVYTRVGVAWGGWRADGASEDGAGFLAGAGLGYTYKAFGLHADVNTHIMDEYDVTPMVRVGGHLTF